MGAVPRISTCNISHFKRCDLADCSGGKYRLEPGLRQCIQVMFFPGLIVQKAGTEQMKVVIVTSVDGRSWNGRRERGVRSGQVLSTVYLRRVDPHPLSGSRHLLDPPSIAVCKLHLGSSLHQFNLFSRDGNLYARNGDKIKFPPPFSSTKHSCRPRRDTLPRKSFDSSHSFPATPRKNDRPGATPRGPRGRGRGGPRPR